ncbi:MAG TPA: glycosyl transferase family 1 [Chitinophagaceae bacterium]|nr:glycosyl transferase family 1 [Chitinophagaceae bacterium]
MPQPLIQNKNIVIVGLQPWDTGIGSNCKNIAEEMSKHNKVLYVNSPLDTKTMMQQKEDPKVQMRLEVLEGKRDGLEKINDNLYTWYPDVAIKSINWLGIPFLFDIINRRNNRKIANSIKHATQRLGMDEFILFNDNDIFRGLYLKEMLAPQVSVYYSRDYLLAVDYWKKHGERLEPEIIKTSDVCTANSTYLAQYCGKYNTNSFYVGQGCDFSIYLKPLGVTPNDIASIPKPIIGYTGFITGLRLDIALLEQIATAKPEWSLVLVGPEDEAFKQSALHQLPNVHFLGSKQPEALPEYVAAFDVCINPQLLNEVTIGNYPRKVDEYLAMGKPVVATQTEAMSIFAEHTYLGTGAQEYMQLIEQALQEHNESLADARKTFALEHTWENSVADIYKAILQVKPSLG